MATTTRPRRKVPPATGTTIRIQRPVHKDLLAFATMTRAGSASDAVGMLLRIWDRMPVADKQAALAALLLPEVNA